MNTLFMTAYNGAILGPIARVFGVIINAIYSFFEDTLNVENVNIAMTIVIFTIVVYIILLPLTYQQQKFSCLSRKINPELNAVRKKYANKRDQESMLKMQEETKVIYDKYGINTMGSCLQLFIQMPILLALYNVFRNIPAYIQSVRNLFDGLVESITLQDGYLSKMQTLYEEADLGRAARLNIDFLGEGLTDSQIKNYIVDVVYKLPSSGWESLKQTFPNITDVIAASQESLANINYVGPLNISETPMGVISTAWSNRAFLIILAALCIPLFSFITQILQLRFMNMSTGSSAGDDPMAAQMKTMNRIMPLMSLFFVFNIPIGLGIYWIIGAIVRTIQQIILNKHFEKIDLNKIIEKNKDKAEEKRKKRGERQQKIASTATMSTRSTMSEKARIGSDKKEQLDAANELRAQAKAGTMASKANLVAEFNKKNNRD